MSARLTLFTAGCGRRVEGPADLAELAYTELAYPECPTCVHRIEPQGVAPFCRWLAPRRDPRQALADLEDLP